jgi:hypothetical protein
MIEAMNELTITFITASTALIAGIASPLVSISVARRQFKASVISNNREKWLEALRESIAEYIALATCAPLVVHKARSVNGDAIYADQEILKTAERMVLVRNRIVLMTNPSKDCHLELCRRIDAVHTALVSDQTVQGEQWRAYLDAITLAGHAVLRFEWARVKRGD